MTRGHGEPGRIEEFFCPASSLKTWGKADEGSQYPTLPPLRGREVSQMEQGNFFAKKVFMFTFERAFLLFQKEPIRGAPSLKGGSKQEERQCLRPRFCSNRIWVPQIRGTCPQISSFLPLTTSRAAEMAEGHQDTFCCSEINLWTFWPRWGKNHYSTPRMYMEIPRCVNKNTTSCLAEPIQYCRAIILQLKINKLEKKKHHQILIPGLRGLLRSWPCPRGASCLDLNTFMSLAT